MVWKNTLEKSSAPGQRYFQPGAIDLPESAPFAVIDRPPARQERGIYAAEYSNGGDP